jgi:hypothetical protein
MEKYNMTDAVETTGALTTEKFTSRKYVKLGTDDKGNTVITDTKIQAEAQAKVTDPKSPYVGMAVNWAKLEEAGYTLFSENEFIRYTVKSVEGFQHLIPAEDQQVYIMQAGLNYIQNAKSNKLMDELLEGAPEPTPASNQETIDLREAINEVPKRQSLTGLEKLLKMLPNISLTDDERKNLIATLLQSEIDAREATEVEP